MPGKKQKSKKPEKANNLQVFFPQILKKALIDFSECKNYPDYCTPILQAVNTCALKQNGDTQIRSVRELSNLFIACIASMKAKSSSYAQVLGSHTPEEEFFNRLFRLLFEMFVSDEVHSLRKHLAFSLVKIIEFLENEQISDLRCILFYQFKTCVFETFLFFPQNFEINDNSLLQFLWKNSEKKMKELQKERNDLDDYLLAHVTNMNNTLESEYFTIFLKKMEAYLTKIDPNSKEYSLLEPKFQKIVSFDYFKAICTFLLYYLNYFLNTEQEISEQKSSTVTKFLKASVNFLQTQEHFFRLSRWFLEVKSEKEGKDIENNDSDFFSRLSTLLFFKVLLKETTSAKEVYILSCMLFFALLKASFVIQNPKNLEKQEAPSLMEFFYFILDAFYMHLVKESLQNPNAVLSMPKDFAKQQFERFSSSNNKNSEKASLTTDNFLKVCFFDHDSALLNEKLSIMKHDSIPLILLSQAFVNYYSFGVKKVISASTGAAEIQISESKAALLENGKFFINLVINIFFPLVLTNSHQSESYLLYSCFLACYDITKKLNFLLEQISLAGIKMRFEDICPNESQQLSLFSLLKKVLDEMIWYNWENPIHNIYLTVRALFQEIVEIISVLNAQQQAKQVSNEEKASKPHFDLFEMLDHLIEHSDWNRKGKYPAILTLFPKFGALKFLEKYPKILDNVIKVVDNGGIRSLTCSLYENVAKDLANAFRTLPDKKFLGKSFEEWIFSPIVDQLSYGSSRHRISIFSLLLPKLITLTTCEPKKENEKKEKKNPKLPKSEEANPEHASFLFLMVELQKKLSMHAKSERVVERALLSLILVLKLGKKSGFLEPEMMNDQLKSVIEKGFRHEDDDISLETIEFLTLGFSGRTNEIPTSYELDSILKFFILNFTNTGTSFRTKYLVILRKFFVRLREAAYRVFKDFEKKGHEFELVLETSDESTLSEEERLKRDSFISLMKFLVSFCEKLHESFYPGVPHEKSLMGLQIFLCVLEELNQFSEIPGSASMKLCEIEHNMNETYQAFTKAFYVFHSQNPLNLRYFHDERLAKFENKTIIKPHVPNFSFFSTSVTIYFIHSLMDCWDSIREQIFYLLEKFPTPLPGFESLERVNEIVEGAMRLIGSPRLRESDAAAFILKLVMKKYVLGLKWKFGYDKNLKKFHFISTGNENSEESDGVGHISSFVNVFQDIIIEKVKLLEGNIFDIASQDCSLVGALTTYRYFFPLIPLSENSDNSSNWNKYLKQHFQILLDQLIKVVQLSMKVISDVSLSHGDVENNEMNPEDFENDEANEEKEGGVEDAHDYHSVVVNSWLSCKESCLLLADILTRVPIPAPISTKEQEAVAVDEEKWLFVPQYYEKVGFLFLNTLINCKHNGAMEKCNVAFTQLCNRLLMEMATFKTLEKGEIISLRSLCADKFMPFLTARIFDMSTSSMRRSAGLTFGFSAILTSEPKDRPRTLLPKVMEFLFEQCEIPDSVLAAKGGEWWKPKVHCLNILTALFKNSILGWEVNSFIERGFLLSLSGFKSVEWSIRNACLRCYTTLINRAFGLSKVRDHSGESLEDESSHVVIQESFSEAFGNNVLWLNDKEWAITQKSILVSSNSITSAEFFSKFGKLRQFLLENLQNATKPSRNSNSAVDPMLFPCLLLISRLQPSRTPPSMNEKIISSSTRRVLNHEDEDNEENEDDEVEQEKENAELEKQKVQQDLRPFIDVVKKSAALNNYMGRSIASRAIIPLVHETQIFEFVQELIENDLNSVISKSRGSSMMNQNRTQGILLQILRLLDFSNYGFLNYFSFFNSFFRSAQLRKEDSGADFSAETEISVPKVTDSKWNLEKIHSLFQGNDDFRNLKEKATNCVAWLKKFKELNLFVLGEFSNSSETGAVSASWVKSVFFKVLEIMSKTISVYLLFWMSIFQNLEVSDFQNFGQWKNLIFGEKMGDLVEILNFLSELSSNSLFPQLKSSIFLQISQLQQKSGITQFVGIQDMKQSAVSFLISFHLFSRVLNSWEQVLNLPKNKMCENCESLILEIMNSFSPSQKSPDFFSASSIRQKLYEILTENSSFDQKINSFFALCEKNQNLPDFKFSKSLFETSEVRISILNSILFLENDPYAQELGYNLLDWIYHNYQHKNKESDSTDDLTFDFIDDLKKTDSYTSSSIISSNFRTFSFVWDHVFEKIFFDSQKSEPNKNPSILAQCFVLFGNQISALLSQILRKLVSKKEQSSHFNEEEISLIVAKLRKFGELIQSYSDPSIDEDIRFGVQKAIEKSSLLGFFKIENEITSNSSGILNSLPKEFQILSFLAWKVSICLLQDENEEIRAKTSKMLAPFVALQLFEEEQQRIEISDKKETKLKKVPKENEKQRFQMRFVIEKSFKFMTEKFFKSLPEMYLKFLFEENILIPKKNKQAISISFDSKNLNLKLPFNIETGKIYSLELFEKEEDNLFKEDLFTIQNACNQFSKVISQVTPNGIQQFQKKLENQFEFIVEIFEKAISSAEDKEQQQKIFWMGAISNNLDVFLVIYRLLAGILLISGPNFDEKTKNLVERMNVFIDQIGYHLPKLAKMIISTENEKLEKDDLFLLS